MILLVTAAMLVTALLALPAGPASAEGHRDCDYALPCPGHPSGAPADYEERCISEWVYDYYWQGWWGLDTCYYSATYPNGLWRWYP